MIGFQFLDASSWKCELEGPQRELVLRRKLGGPYVMSSWEDPGVTDIKLKKKNNRITNRMTKKNGIVCYI